MTFMHAYGRRGFVEGLGDEQIPWWIAPHVRDFVALAKSAAVRSAVLAAAANPTPQPALEALTARVAQTAAAARIAVHVEGGKQLAAGVTSALRADIDEFCGTPPRPHHLSEAALAVALLASGLEERDPAKAVLVVEAERLQQKLINTR